jgi:hypothetical protein
MRISFQGLTINGLFSCISSNLAAATAEHFRTKGMPGMWIKDAAAVGVTMGASTASISAKEAVEDALLKLRRSGGKCLTNPEVVKYPGGFHRFGGYSPLQIGDAVIAWGDAEAGASVRILSVTADEVAVMQEKG